MIAFRYEARSAVSEALKTSGLVPAAKEYSAVRADITNRGYQRFADLKDVVGSRALSDMLRSLGRRYPEDDCVRVLGFGDALTHFLVAPLDIPDTHLEEPLHLGATANFLVSTYDSLVDAGVAGERLLPRGALRQAIFRDKQWRLGLLGVLGSSRTRVLSKITLHYLRRLHRSPGALRRPTIISALHRTIWRMYEAECATLDRGIPTERVLRRKAALPFLTMGLPGWLAAVEPRAELGWHVRWMCRVGEFFGCVDDIVDLDEDLAAGRPNRVALRNRGSDHEEAVAEQISRLATEGARILREWRSRVRDPDALPAHVRLAFGVCAGSWCRGAMLADE